MSDTNEKIIEKPKRQKAITQQDLDAFKDNMLSVLDERLDAFIDDFLEAWQESNNTDNTESCDCPECTGEKPLDNPRRYMIQAGGNMWWVDNFKPNSMAGLDVIWTEELGGKTKIVRGTIMSQDVSIFDFENDLDLETFDNIKKATIDFAIQTAQEAQAREKAAKATSSNQEVCTDSSSHVSYG
jgi:hypothetical protein